MIASQLLLLCTVFVLSWQLDALRSHAAVRARMQSRKILELFAADDSSIDERSDTDANKPALPAEQLAALKEEAASPFRLLRQFIYGAMFAGGGVGTVTQLPQLIQAFQNDGDKVNALINVGVDSGAVLAAVILWKTESDKASLKLDAFKDKQRVMNNQISSDDATKRETNLSLLPVEIQVNQKDENATRIVSLNDLQINGFQNIIIVTGDEKFVKDAVISARLEGNDMFNSRDTMVIPFICGEPDNQLDAKKSKGFGKQETLMSSPYIAKPQQLKVWESFMQEEIVMAEKQGTEDAAKKGVVIALKKTGKVVRRGIGLPPWKKLIEEEFKNT